MSKPTRATKRKSNTSENPPAKFAKKEEPKHKCQTRFYTHPVSPSGGVTFQVTDKLFKDDYPPEEKKTADYIDSMNSRYSQGSKVLISTGYPNTVVPDLKNGFVGAALRAYNNHYHLVLKPDDVWIAILTSLSRYIQENAEKLRENFVSHEGKVELEVVGGGTILSADYETLLKDMMIQMKKYTKDNITNWAECDFTTSDEVSKTVSRVALMGSMSKYFDYKMSLCCGLPKVTLEGTKEDWEKLQKKTKQISKWKDETLVAWHKILKNTLQHFIDAFDSKVDKDFWNRIAHIEGGGSGPRYLQGWILSFIAFKDDGKYFLNKLEEILKTNSYGTLDTNDVPTNFVEVPVKINDNGTLYNVKFLPGSIVNRIENGIIRPSIDWAIVDVTNEKKKDRFCMI